MNGTLLSLHIGTRKGHSKTPVSRGLLRVAHGLEGDAHAGPWHRQLSLLALGDIESMRARGLPDLRFGSFAENMVIGGLDFECLGPGSRLRIGREVDIRITQSARSVTPPAPSGPRSATASCQRGDFSPRSRTAAKSLLAMPLKFLKWFPG